MIYKQRAPIMSSCACGFYVVLMVSAQEIRLQIDAIPEIMLEITQNSLRAEGNDSITILWILIFGFVRKFGSAFISSR